MSRTHWKSCGSLRVKNWNSIFNNIFDAADVAVGQALGGRNIHQGAAPCSQNRGQFFQIQFPLAGERRQMEVLL